MIEIAKVLKPQGLKGEIKVEIYSSDLNFWHTLKDVFIDNVNYQVENVRFYKSFGYIKLCTVNTLEEAETFRNKKICVDNSLLKSEDDSYIISDLEQCTIVDENNNLVGYVESIEKYGSADIINFLISGARYSFPFLKHVIKSVDVKNKTIVVFKEKLQEVQI